MVMNPTMTVVGNVAGDPELRFTQSGIAAAKFTVAWTERKKDGDNWVDGETLWVRVTAWRRLAENVAESVTKGTRVMVSGKVRPDNWEKDGQKRRDYELVADEVGVCLSGATATARRNAPRDGGAQQGQGTQSRQQGGSNDWADGEF